MDPREKPSPWVAAGSSFAMFAIGAIVPLIPYLLGFESLWAGCCAAGSASLSRVAGRGFHRRPLWFGSLRQLAFGRSPSPRPTLSAAWSIPFFSALAPSMALLCCLMLSACGVADTNRPFPDGPHIWARYGSNEDMTFDGTVVGGLSGLSLRRRRRAVLHHQRRPVREEPCPLLYCADRPVRQRYRRRRVRLDPSLAEPGGKPFAP